MRDYGIVSPRFWTGETGKQLRGDRDAQVLALYLMTSPHSTMTGVFHCPILYMSHETGIPFEGASKALARLIEGGFCEYDVPSETVFVVQMAKFQIGESLKPADKRVFGLRKEVDRMQKGRLKQRFLEVYAEAYCIGDLLETPSPLVAPSEPHRSQEQDQDQEQDQEQNQNTFVDGEPSTPQCPHLEIIALYNRILPELQAVIPERWDGTRAKHLQARWRESAKHQTLEFWEKFFTVLRNYSWYLGDNDRGWKANLGWIVEKRNFDNLIEKFVTDSRRSGAA